MTGPAYSTGPLPINGTNIPSAVQGTLTLDKFMPVISKSTSANKATGRDKIPAQFFKFHKVMGPVWGSIDQMVNGTLNLFEL